MGEAESSMSIARLEDGESARRASCSRTLNQNIYICLCGVSPATPSLLLMSAFRSRLNLPLQPSPSSSSPSQVIGTDPRLLAITVRQSYNSLAGNKLTDLGTPSEQDQR